MKYCSINRLKDFEFHDSEFTFESYIDNRLVVLVKFLNVHKGTEHNTSDFDMEIELARIVFEGFSVLSFTPCRTWKLDENGNSYSDDPEVIFTGEEATDSFIHELKEGITVYDLDKDENHIYSIDACGEMPFFSGTFTCDSLFIEWDSYRKKAWYELHKVFNKEILLATPTGIEKTVLRITCVNEEDEASFITKQDVILSMNYKEKQYFGRGTDYLWVDAFADLQKQLPDDVTIMCCMTCRHGNMCPVGNQPNELFCTKDVIITQKSDLFFYTEDDTERNKRSREYTHSCESYMQQTEDYYTYNDYLYQLQK